MNLIRDTPYKVSPTGVETNAGVEADSYREQTRIEVLSNTYLTEEKAFINRKFPFKNDATAVFEALKAQESYANQRWADTPSDNDPEEKYYPFFANTANNIKNTFERIKGRQFTEPFKSRWIAQASKTPKSTELLSPLIRPDVVLSLVSNEEDDLWERIKDLERDLAELEKALAAVPEKRKLQKAKEGIKKMEKELAGWWSRLVIAVEVKLQLKSLNEHVEQLACYLCQVMREQLDRRCAIGLLLCKSQLSVWQADRSGLLGTKASFNIHQNPELFIQVILGCSYGDPSLLGFDTSMKMWRGGRGQLQALPSYHPEINRKDYERAPSEKNWVIPMPSKANPEITEEFLTIYAISTTRVETLSGRATVVWIVMKMEDVEQPNHDIFVLKQTWHPETADAEEDLIPKGVDNISKVYSATVVASDTGAIVSTAGYLRHGVEHLVPAEEEDPKIRAADMESVRHTEEMETKPLMFSKLNTRRQQADAPVLRTQKRILLEDYGWPIHRFRNLKELLTVLKQVTEAQRNLYFHQATLQRDISTSNILICPSKDDYVNTKASLIDFDCAKRARSWMPSMLKLLDAIEDIDDMEDSWSPIKKLCERLVKKEIDGRLNALFDVYLDRGSFLNFNNVLGLGKDPSPLITAPMIGLLPKETRIPNFYEREAHSRDRIATIPFASPEVLTTARLFGQSKVRPLAHDILITKWEELQAFTDANKQFDLPFFHDFIHDIDGTFWVFTYICLSQTGAGCNRGEALIVPPIGSQDDDGLYNLVESLFNSEKYGVSEIAEAKTEVLTVNKQDLPSHFAPYFSPVKALWNEWRALLNLAYMYPTFEMHHDFLLKAFDKAILDLPPPPKDKEGNEKLTEDEKKVDEERKAILDYLRNFPRSQETLSMPTMVTLEASTSRGRSDTREKTGRAQTSRPGKSKARDQSMSPTPMKRHRPNSPEPESESSL